MATHIPRQLVYVLTDTSGSMIGEALDSVNNGLTELRRNLVNDNAFAEIGWVSVITFGGKVQKAVPLTQIKSFQPPTLSADGGTPLGGALQEAVDSAKADIVKPVTKDNGDGTKVQESPGDYKPAVLIMTDGKPNDDYERGLQTFLDYKSSSGKSKWGAVIALAAGPDADVSFLKRIAPETTYKMGELTPDMWAKFFRWLVQSISSITQSSITGKPVNPAELPPPPSGITRC